MTTAETFQSFIEFIWEDADYPTYQANHDAYSIAKEKYHGVVIKDVELDKDVWKHFKFPDGSEILVACDGQGLREV